MWIKTGVGKPEAGHFDQHYLNSENAQVDLQPNVQERLDELMAMVGEVQGKRVLDLGGGALIGRVCQNAEKYTLVEYSKEAIRIAQKVAPWTDGRLEDVERFLLKNVLASDDGRPTVLAEEFDVTVCVGMVDYLPSHGLDLIFRLAPSPVLAFTNAVKEGYLKYEARITIPTREEVMETADKRRWKITRELKKSDHVWARFERK